MKILFYIIYSIVVVTTTTIVIYVCFNQSINKLVVCDYLPEIGVCADE